MKRFNSVIRLLAKCCLQGVFPESLLLCRMPRRANRIAITFDDGPHPQNTIKILAELEKRGIKATFFVLGSQLAKNRELGTLLLERGHELGNHTLEHMDLRLHTIQEFHRTIMKTEAIISACGKTSPGHILIRTPFGIINHRVLLYILKNRFLLAGWTLDSGDSFIREARGLAIHVSKMNIRTGDILLFHEDCTHTVEALPCILDHLCERGFQFVTIGDYFESVRRK